MVVHACNPSNWEAKAGGPLWVQSQPGLHSEALSKKDRQEKEEEEEEQVEEDNNRAMWQRWLEEESHFKYADYEKSVRKP